MSLRCSIDDDEEGDKNGNVMKGQRDEGTKRRGDKEETKGTKTMFVAKWQ